MSNPTFVGVESAATECAARELADSCRAAVARQSALDRGVAALDLSDLLALLAGDGGARLLASWSLAELARADAWTLKDSLDLDGAVRISAAFELGRRAEVALRSPRSRLDCAAEVQRRLATRVRGLDQELFFVLALDGKHALLREQCVSMGSLNSSLVHPREVFRPAIAAAAAAVICAHNHPSGDPEPSAEDLTVTRRLVEAGKLLGIPLLDHVVLGDQSYVSLRQRAGWT